MREPAVDGSRFSGQEEVCAVIVSYNCGPAILDTAQNVAAQVGHLVIVDNASDPASVSILAELERKLGERLTLIRNEWNAGIAAALNQGARVAIQRGCAWLLTLDQDSVVDASMVAKMLQIDAELQDRDSIGILAPTSVDTMTGQPCPLYAIPGTGRAAGSSGRTTEVALVHASGNMIKTRVFDEGILFRDDYFIDCVDTEFCLRLRRRGHRIVVLSDVTMRHTTGDVAKGHLWGRDFVYPTHSANRNYYMTRNGIALFLETRDLDFFLPYMRNLTLQYAFSLLCEEGKWARLAALMQGTMDGIMHRLGPRRQGEQAPDFLRGRD